MRDSPLVRPTSYCTGPVGVVIELGAGHRLLADRTEVYAFRYLEHAGPSLVDDVAQALVCHEHIFWRDISAPRLRVLVLAALRRLVRKGFVQALEGRDARGRPRKRYRYVPPAERRTEGPGKPPQAG